MSSPDETGGFADWPERHELPPDVELVRTTPVFTESSVPAGLLAAHRVAPGVWGRLIVSSGSVRFRFEDEEEGRTIGAAGSVVIPPDLPHRLEIVGPVNFVVEFHRSRTGPE